MKAGTVVEIVTAARAMPWLEGKGLVAVDCGGQSLVALNPAGAEKGERVLLVTGAAAARICMDAPVDAAVVAVLGKG